MLNEVSSILQKNVKKYEQTEYEGQSSDLMTGSGKTHGFNRGMKASFFSFAF